MEEFANQEAAGGIFMGLFFLGFLVLGILSFIIWLWALIDCATKESSEGNDKIVWILIIVFLQIFGAILYFAIRRPQRNREQRTSLRA